MNKIKLGSDGKRKAAFINMASVLIGSVFLQLFLHQIRNNLFGKFNRFQTMNPGSVWFHLALTSFHIILSFFTIFLLFPFPCPSPCWFFILPLCLALYHPPPLPHTSRCLLSSAVTLPSCSSSVTPLPTTDENYLLKILNFGLFTPFFTKPCR